MRSMKSRFSANKESAQPEEGVDLREGLGSSYQSWNDSNAAGPEAISFQKQPPGNAQPQQQSLLQQKTLTSNLQTQSRDQVPITDTQEEIVQVPINVEHIRTVKQTEDVPVIQQTQRNVIVPVQEAVVTHELLEADVAVPQVNRKPVTVPKVVMKQKEIDVPVISKVKKVIEVEIDQDVIEWEKQVVQEPVLEYEEQVLEEQVLGMEKQLIDVPVVQEVTKEVEIPIVEQSVVWERQEIEVPIIEKETQIFEQPVTRKTVKMVPETVEAAGTQSSQLRQSNVGGTWQQDATLASPQFTKVSLANQEPSKQQLSLDEVLQRKHQQQLQGQYNIQHDAELASRINEVS